MSDAIRWEWDEANKHFVGEALEGVVYDPSQYVIVSESVPVQWSDTWSSEVWSSGFDPCPAFEGNRKARRSKRREWKRNQRLATPLHTLPQ